MTYCTSGSAPSQPDPPMLSEVYVTEFLISWIKRPNDDEFVLQLEDEVSVSEMQCGHKCMLIGR